MLHYFIACLTIYENTKTICTKVTPIFDDQYNFLEHFRNCSNRVYVEMNDFKSNEYLEVFNNFQIFKKIDCKNSKCYMQYNPWNFVFSQTLFEFITRILSSRFGRGSVLLSGSKVNKFPAKHISEYYNHQIIYDYTNQDWILLWVHYYQHDEQFCDYFHKIKQSTVTYFLVYVKNEQELVCLFKNNLRIYVLLSHENYMPNHELKRNDRIRHGYVFATYGNDIAIPDEYVYFDNHKKLDNFLNCPVNEKGRLPTIVENKIEQPLRNIKNQPNIIVLLLDAVSEQQFKIQFPQTKLILEKKRMTQIQNYNAVGEYSGPNQMALYKTNNMWIWDELTKLGYKTLKIENSCIKHSAMMKTANVSTTHGTEFNEYFCKKRNLPDCIDGHMTIDTLMNIGEQFLNIYKNQTYAAFIHVENLHEDTMTFSFYADKVIAEFVNKINFNDKFIILSDHGLHYGVYSNTYNGIRENLQPFAYHNFEEYIHPTPFHIGFKLRSLTKLDQILPCRVTVPSVMTYFADTNNLKRLNCLPYSKKVTISSNTIRFEKSRSCKTHRISLKNCKILNFSNEDRYIASNGLIQTLPFKKNSQFKKEVISIIILEIDSLSRAMFHRFFKKTRKMINSLNFKTNMEFTNFNVVGEKSIPNQASLLSGCKHHFLKNKVVGELFDCEENIYKLMKRNRFKTLFGEEFCTGKWSISNIMKIRSDYMINEAYCGINYNPMNHLCIGNNISSFFPMTQLNHMINNYIHEKHFAFLSLIPLHTFLKRLNEYSNWYTGFYENLPILNLFDDFLADALKELIKTLAYRKFILILKGDHGHRTDLKLHNKLSDRIEHINPYLHIVSNKIRIDSESQKNLVSPFDLYNFLVFLAKNENLGKKKHLFPSQSCYQAKIPLRFCECQNLSMLSHDFVENL